MSRSKGSINYQAVRRYFDKAAMGGSAEASYMAHGQDLPFSATRYRFKAEQRTIADWLNEIPRTSAVLDAGCGAGTWTEAFADRYAHVTGIEGSASMAEAARRQTRDAPNVEIVECNVLGDVPDREYQLAFLGGLCMYLSDDDAVTLLRTLKTHRGGVRAIVMRESTVVGGAHTTTGDYQAVYRTVEDYQALFARVGFSRVETRRNYGYTNMETAIEVVNARRKWLSFLPRQSRFLGAMTWWGLRLTSPISFWALPRVLKIMSVAWPRLQNHFFRLTP